MIRSKRATIVPAVEPVAATQPETEVSAAEAEEEVSEGGPAKSEARPRATAGSSKSKGRSRKKVAEPELEPEPEDEEEVEVVESQAPSQAAAVDEVISSVDEPSKPSRKIKSRPTKGRGKKVEPEDEVVDKRRDSIKPTSTASRSQPSQSSRLHPSQPPQTQPSQPDRPLSQLNRFSNIPPSSPVKPSTPKSKPINLPREVLDDSVRDGALQARSVIEELAKENEEGLRKPLLDDQKGMTLEELVRSEMRIRYEVMEREGEALIGKWEERTRESRKRIEAV